MGVDEKFARLGTREQVIACMQLAQSKGLDFMVLDQTRPDVGVPVVRVVPGCGTSIVASRPAACTMFQSSLECAPSR